MKICITVFLIVLFEAATAQHARLDSLDRLIAQAQSDTARINLINQKNTIIGRINIDSAMDLCNKAIRQSRMIKYEKGEAEARLSLATNYCMKGVFESASKNLDMSKNLFLSLGDSAGLCNTYSGYGMMYGMQSRYDTSIIYLEKAIGIAERNNFQDKLSTFYGNIAVSHQMKSDFLRALRYQQKSLNIAKARNDISEQAYTNINMGLTYYNMGDYTRAREYMLESIRLAKMEGIKNVELYAYSNLANLYGKNKEHQTAYNYAMKAARLGDEMGDHGIQSASLAKAAESLAGLSKMQEAESLAKQAIKIADSSGQSYNVYQAYSAMGSILKQRQKFNEAIPFLEKSVAILEETDLYNETVGFTYNILSECYAKTGNFSKALQFYKSSAEIKDSISNRDNIRKATELGMNYEFDIKQEAQRIEQRSKDAVTQSRQSALLTVFILTLILGIGAFIAYRNKQKANRQLQLQKIELESTLTKLKETQNQLVHSEKMASLGELTAGIAHEIQNPLNFVNNFSEVNSELIAEMKEEINRGNLGEARNIINDIEQNELKINHHGKRADMIVKGMLQHSRTKTGQKELTDINVLAEEYLRLSYHGLRAKDKLFSATIKTDLDKNLIKLKVVPTEVGRVLLNLYNNAFYAVAQMKKKQGDEYEPAVSVTTKMLDDSVTIEVKDNGVGIPLAVQEKIFQPFFTTKPTGEGTGLGLSMSYDIIKAHGGKLTVGTPAEQGAVFIIQLPMD